MNSLRRFLRSEDGPTAVEYAVMLALILILCIGAIGVLGTSTFGSFQDSNDRIQTAVGS